MTHSKPIGITSGRVTEIKVESKELAGGQVKRRKPLLPRPRRCLRTIQAHELVNWRHAGGDQLVISARGRTGAGAIPKGEIAHVAHLSPTTLPPFQPTPKGLFTTEL